MSLDMQSAWTRYWSRGHTSSCAEDQIAGRNASLQSAWREFFSGFAERAKLLDLATGGGEVIRIAIGLGRDFDITGVDLADLSAVGRTLQADVELVGNTDLARLPFPDGAFDGVTSQFGIEYADIAAATCEAVRVLAADGRGRFLHHHPDSAITRGGEARLEAFRSVFAGSRAFEFGKTVFELYQGSSPRAAIAQAEARFWAEVRTLQDRLTDEPPFADARMAAGDLLKLARAPVIHAPGDALKRLDAMEEKIQEWSLRQDAQTNAALDRERMDLVCECLTRAGAVVDPPEELRDGRGQILAWSCSFHR